LSGVRCGFCTMANSKAAQIIIPLSRLLDLGEGFPWGGWARNFSNNGSEKLCSGIDGEEGNVVSVGYCWLFMGWGTERGSKSWRKWGAEEVEKH